MRRITIIYDDGYHEHFDGDEYIGGIDKTFPDFLVILRLNKEIQSYFDCITSKGFDIGDRKVVFQLTIPVTKIKRWSIEEEIDDAKNNQSER